MLFLRVVPEAGKAAGAEAQLFTDEFDNETGPHFDSVQGPCPVFAAVGLLQIVVKGLDVSDDFISTLNIIVSCHSFFQSVAWNMFFADFVQLGQRAGVSFADSVCRWASCRLFPAKRECQQSWREAAVRKKKEGLCLLQR